MSERDAVHIVPDDCDCPGAGHDPFVCASTAKRCRAPKYHATRQQICGEALPCAAHAVNRIHGPGGTEAVLFMPNGRSCLMEISRAASELRVLSSAGELVFDRLKARDEQGRPIYAKRAEAP